MRSVRSSMRASFNSRPREAGDPKSCNAARRQSVSIHARARRATLIITVKRVNTKVSIHARARRATLALLRFLADKGFNSRPREAGDLLFLCAISPLVVSIHARARRATATICAIIAIVALQRALRR